MGILSTLGGFALSPIKKYLMIGGIAIVIGLVGMLGYYKYQLVVAEKNLITLKVERVLLKGEIETQKKIIAKKELARKLTDTRLTEQLQEAAELDAMLEIIRNAKEEDDGPVAPILRSTLERLRND